MTGRRADRVADRIRRLLAGLIQETVRDPRVGFVTLTDVRLSTDLRQAQAFVTILGGAEPAEALAALNHAVPFLRRSLAQKAGLRFTPQITFHVDDVEESGRRVDELLEQIRSERSGEDEEESP
jgi:ribosome-binding factor A